MSRDLRSCRRLLLIAFIASTCVLIALGMTDSTDSDEQLDRVDALPHATPVVVDLQGRAWGKRIGDWQLTVFTRKQVFDVGEEIPIYVARRNATDEPLDAAPAYIDLEYVFEVVDDIPEEPRQDAPAFDAEVALHDAKRFTDAVTRYGIYYATGHHLSNASLLRFHVPHDPVIVPPGQAMVQRIRINAIRDMTLPAGYTITVKAQSKVHDLGEDIYSLVAPPIEVTVRDLGHESWARRVSELERKRQEQE